MQPLLLFSASDLQAFLDTPKQLLQQSVELQLAIASFVNTPRSLLEILVNSPAEVVVEAATLHVNYAGEIVDNWQDLVDEILPSHQMGQNDRLAVELLKLGAVPSCFFSEWVPAEKLIQALRNPQMPLRYRLQLLERLAPEPTLEPRLQVAEAAETPLAVLEQLAGDLEFPVRLAVKFNPSCPPALIELVEGQYAVASDWNGDGEQLGMLGQSRCTWIRLAVAQNPNTPQATLMELARDKVYKIQLAVAKNPGTSAEVLALLAEHEDKIIQEAVAEHGNLTEEIMHQLFPNQQAVFRKRKNLPTSVLERFFNERNTDKPQWKDNELRHLLLSHANTPTWILAELANDDIRFLDDIAKHPQVSVEILEKLVHYPNILMKLAVAQNSQTPDAIRMQLFEELVLSNEKKILQKLASNPKTPVSILEKIGEQESPQNKFRTKLRQLLTRDMNANSLSSVADMCMDEARKILNQHQTNVDIEEWMTLIDSYQWMTLLENYNYFGDLQRRYREDADFRDMVNEQWQQLLPTLPESELLKVIDSILEIPDSLVEDIQGDRHISVALVGNSSTPVTLREELQRTLTARVNRYGSRSDDSDMRMALAYNTQIPEVERMRYFQSLILESQNYRKETIATNPLTPLSILEQLLEQGQQQGIAQNPIAPEYLLRKIADSPQPHDYILRTIAENPHAPADLLMRFVRHPHENKTSSNVSMYDIVIANPNLPTIERYRLILEKEEAEEIAKAHKLMAFRSDSPYALAQVIKKGDQNAKMTAARSYKTPIQVLKQLAKDADETIRYIVIENPNLPLSTLLELTEDTSLRIRAALARHRQNQKVPLQILERLANDESPRVRAEVAANPETPVELLRNLASDSDQDVWNALTRNQNTPVDVLEFLGVEKGVVNIYNSKTPEKALEKAVENALKKDFSSRDEALKKLLPGVQGSQMPGSVLAKLATYKTSWVRSSVADHPNTPISALEPLLNDDYAPVLWAIARRADTPPHFLERLLQGKDKNSRDYKQICSAICHRQDIPHLREKLMDSNQRQVYRGIAAQPNLPPAIVERLLATSDERVLTTLAYNQSLSSEFLARLVENRNPKVCIAIVRNPNITQQLWEKLAQHKDVSVRQTIAANSNTPVNILEVLANDLDKDVRAKIASNTNLPVILEQLAQDEEGLVRTAVASNLNLTQAIFTRLANDEKIEVRRAVVKNPTTPSSIRENIRDFMVKPAKQQTISPTLRGLSRLYNPDTDDLPTILTEYSQSENAFVRFITLTNPQTPVEILTQAAQSASWLERYAVADNPAISGEIRLSLTQDSNRIVRAAAKANC